MDPIQPDAESLLVRFLAGHPVLTPLHGGRVGTDLAPEGTYPAQRITFVSGVRVNPWEWLVRLQVESWGNTRGDCSELARTTAAVLDDLYGTHLEGEVRGHDATVPYWAPGPDSEGGRPRFNFDAQILLYPTYVPVPEF